eukprot:486539-Amphidinium_carterae.1
MKYDNTVTRYMRATPKSLSSLCTRAQDVAAATQKQCRLTEPDTARHPSHRVRPKDPRQAACTMTWAKSLGDLACPQHTTGVHCSVSAQRCWLRVRTMSLTRWSATVALAKSSRLALTDAPPALRFLCCTPSSTCILSHAR